MQRSSAAVRVAFCQFPAHVRNRWAERTLLQRGRSRCSSVPSTPVDAMLRTVGGRGCGTLLWPRTHKYTHTNTRTPYTHTHTHNKMIAFLNFKDPTCISFSLRFSSIRCCASRCRRLMSRASSTGSRSLLLDAETGRSLTGDCERLAAELLPMLGQSNGNTALKFTETFAAVFQEATAESIGALALSLSPSIPHRQI